MNTVTREELMGVKPWWKASQDLQDDQETFEMQERFGPHAWRFMCKVFATTYKNENEFTLTTDGWELPYARLYKMKPKTVLGMFAWMIQKGWLQPCDPLPEAYIKSGDSVDYYPRRYKLSKWLKYNDSQKQKEKKEEKRSDQKRTEKKRESQEHESCQNPDQPEETEKQDDSLSDSLRYGEIGRGREEHPLEHISSLSASAKLKARLHQYEQEHGIPPAQAQPWTQGVLPRADEESAS